MGHNCFSAYISTEPKDGRKKGFGGVTIPMPCDIFWINKGNAEEIGLRPGDYKRLETDPEQTAALMLTDRLILQSRRKQLFTKE